MILSHTIQVNLSLLGRKNCPQTRSLGLYKQNPPARVLRESAQADFGFVAAISNRLVLLLLRKGELLQSSSVPAQVPVAFEQSKLFQRYSIEGFFGILYLGYLSLLEHYLLLEQ